MYPRKFLSIDSLRNRYSPGPVNRFDRKQAFFITRIPQPVSRNNFA